MGKHDGGVEESSGDRAYKELLRTLQIQPVKVQRHVTKHDHKVLIIFGGWDASEKDGTIKRIVEYLSSRETQVLALG